MSASVIDRFFAYAGMVAMRAAWQCSIAPAPGVRGFSSIHVEATKNWTDQMLFVDARETRHGQLTIDPYIYAPFWTDQLLRRSVR
jgi:hypothetical protein